MTNARYMKALKSAEYKSHGLTGLETKTELAKDYWKHSRLLEVGHPAQRYLESRNLWPLFDNEDLRGGRRYDSRTGIDAFFLIAPLWDHEGHMKAIQYLRLNSEGEPLIAEDGHKDRVTIGPAKGCAFWPVYICPPRVGVAEGLETAMAVRRLYDIPCFATLGSWGLKAFRPPGAVKDLVIFADHDKPGLAAATHLHDRLRGLRDLGGESPTAVSIVRPEQEGWDFADVWEDRP